MNKKSTITFGFILGIAALILVFGGVYFYKREAPVKIAEATLTPPQSIDGKMTITTSQELDLTPLFGKSAEKLATILAQGDEQNEASYKSAFMSGLDMAIIIKSEDENSNTTQTLYIVDQKVANQSLSITGSHKVISHGTYSSLKPFEQLLEEKLKEKEQTVSADAVTAQEELPPAK